jgi:hypothetical protein
VRFDAKIRDPVERVVGQAFQFVENVLEKHGVTATSSEKEIGNYLIAAVKPKQLRERVECAVRTTAGNKQATTLAGVYDIILEMYILFF